METIVKVGVGRLLALSDLFQQNYPDATSEEWIRWQEKSVAQKGHTKYEIYSAQEEDRCGRERKTEVRVEGSKIEERKVKNELWRTSRTVCPLAFFFLVGHFNLQCFRRRKRRQKR